GQVRFARDHVVRQFGDPLTLGFVTYFGAAEDDYNVWTDPLERGNDLGCLGHIPNINAKPNDFGTFGQQLFNDVERLLVDVELAQRCTIGERPEVGQEVAQPKGSMNIFGVEGGEDDIRHREAKVSAGNKRRNGRAGQKSAVS